jgi:hypothetical protein
MKATRAARNNKEEQQASNRAKSKTRGYQIGDGKNDETKMSTKMSKR